MRLSFEMTPNRPTNPLGSYIKILTLRLCSGAGFLAQGAREKWGALRVLENHLRLHMFTQLSRGLFVDGQKTAKMRK